MTDEKTISFRLDFEIAEKINATGKTQSEFIRNAIVAALNKKPLTRYEINHNGKKIEIWSNDDLAELSINFKKVK